MNLCLKKIISTFSLSHFCKKSLKNALLGVASYALPEKIFIKKDITINRIDLYHRNKWLSAGIKLTEDKTDQN